MGEVYRARDTRLGREVAIKLLRAEVTGDAERGRRFEQEARAVASLSHPNILALFDVGSHEGRPYLVTELLEGQTLAERIRTGDLTVAKSVELATQIAHGLAAAHERGIVHRDLKPGNVVVTRDGVVKILDFGLARLTQTDAGAWDWEGAPTETGLTGAGSILGTVGYMAPEQVRGLPADHRSDIFSFGCVLYEMVTGKHAFKRETAVETMTAILREPAPEISTLGVLAAPELNRIVAHCLEKKPNERFQSASDVAFALQSIANGGIIVEPMPVRRSLRSALVGTSLVLMVLAAAAALRWWAPWRAHQPSVVLDPNRIVVAVFENQTGDRSLDPLSRMTSDWITQGLSRVEGLEVVPSTSVLVAQPPGRPVSARLDPLQVLAADTGAGIVVSGSYYLQGETLHFQAAISDTAHRKLLYALDPTSSAVATPLDAIDDLQQRVTGALATRFESPYEISLQKPPTYEAYREYISGFELFLTDDSEALRHMERAAELDPEFATPVAFILFLRRVRGDWDEVEAVMQRAEGMRHLLTPLGRDYLDGESAWVLHRYADALQAFRSARQRAPRDPMINHWLGITGISANRPEEVAASFGSFAEQPWGDHPLGATWISLHGDALHLLGRYEGELEEARRGREQSGESADIRSSEVSALAALGRVDELDRALREIEAAGLRSWTAGEALLLAAAELRAHGHRDESLQIADRAVAWYRGRTPQESAMEVWRRGLAEALAWAEQWRDARPLYDQLVAGGSPEIGDLGMLGVAAARAGDRDIAVRVAGELEHLDRKWLFGVHAWHRAGIAASLGEKEKAVELLREAFAQGQPYGAYLHRSLALETLHGFAPFEDLIRPKG
jgi:serine/threonine protein kinase/tetratricopeptide (TPR) repeat protein